MTTKELPEAMRNPFKIGLRERTRMIGLWVSSASHIVTEVLGNTGFDWLLIDAEHSTNEIQTLVPQMMSLKGTKTSAVVRPAWNDFVLIKRMLDIGFWNFLIPMVQTEEEARAAVEATLYPPYGIRGVSVMARANDFGAIPGYHHHANQAIAVTTQVETQKTLDNLEKICAIDGLDGVFVGPQDLAASLGHILDSGHADVQKAIRHAAEVAKGYNKAAGILTPNEEEARRYIEWGYTFVAVGADLGLLKNAAAGLAKRFK